ncbi:hypothetical protein IVB03_09285 [Bradyrhizobium sp. 168]|nr:hypothetical protein [Bradyrhizobium sp. 168]
MAKEAMGTDPFTTATSTRRRAFSYFALVRALEALHRELLSGSAPAHRSWRFGEEMPLQKRYGAFKGPFHQYGR